MNKFLPVALLFLASCSSLVQNKGTKISSTSATQEKKKDMFKPIEFSKAESEKYIDPRFSHQPNFINAQLYAPGCVHIMMVGIVNPKDTLEINIENTAVDSTLGGKGDNVMSFQYTHNNDDIHLPDLVRVLKFNEQDQMLIKALYKENSLESEQFPMSEYFTTNHVKENFNVELKSPLDLR